MLPASDPIFCCIPGHTRLLGAGRWNASKLDPQRSVAVVAQRKLVQTAPAGSTGPGAGATRQAGQAGLGKAGGRAGGQAGREDKQDKTRQERWGRQAGAGGGGDERGGDRPGQARAGRADQSVVRSPAPSGTSTTAGAACWLPDGASEDRRVPALASRFSSAMCSAARAHTTYIRCACLLQKGRRAERRHSLPPPPWGEEGVEGGGGGKEGWRRRFSFVRPRVLLPRRHEPSHDGAAEKRGKKKEPASRPRPQTGGVGIPIQGGVCVVSVRACPICHLQLCNPAGPVWRMVAVGLMPSAASFRPGAWPRSNSPSAVAGAVADALLPGQSHRRLVHIAGLPVRLEELADVVVVVLVVARGPQLLPLTLYRKG